MHLGLVPMCPYWIQCRLIHGEFEFSILGPLVGWQVRLLQQVHLL